MMRRLFLLGFVVAVLAGCASEDSETVKPEVQQMKAGARGKRR